MVSYYYPGDGSVEKRKIIVAKFKTDTSDRGLWIGKRLTILMYIMKWKNIYFLILDCGIHAVRIWVGIYIE